jgi:ABC-type glycerol-3-phosphate transport system substrate-binding protein
MKRLALLLIVIAAAAAGCSNKPPPTFAWDKAASFASIKTFAWHDGPPFEYPRGMSIVDGAFIDKHVRADVEAELARKGYRKAEAGAPDIFVTYITSPGGIVDHDVWGSYNWWSQSIYVASNYYKEGVLALDIRDPGKKLIWRGVISRIVGRNPEEVADTIEHAVQTLLKNFPPAPAP